MVIRIVVPLLILILAASCASTGSERSSRNRDLLTADEIMRSNVSTVYEAIRQLRPRFLRVAGTQTFGLSGEDETVVVYLDGVRFGGPDTLHRISAGSIRQVRYLDAPRATTKYGTGHMHGAIEVVTLDR